MSALVKVQASALFIAAAAVATACACHRQPTSAAFAHGEVKVEVEGIDLDREAGTPFVMLEDVATQRGLPIWIGDSEARTILLEMHGVAPPRPMTSDLLRDTIERTGNHVDRVVITQLHDKTYYASIYLNSGRYALDSRPSDAIALALGTHTPIYVAAELFDPENTVDLRAQGGPSTSSGLGITVQALSADLAGFFKAPPDGGVLVADVDTDAAHAGLERGDVITKIANRPVRNLEDFDREVTAAKGAAPVPMTVIRDGRQRDLALAVAGN